MATTFRVDLRAGLLDLLTDFVTAQPAALVRALPVRPENLPAHETPYAYVDLRGEQASHTAGVRTRLAGPSIVLVDQISDNAETVAAFDATVDLFMDHATARPHLVTGTIWDRITVTDEFDEGMYLVRFAFDNVSISEGRN